MFRVQCRLRRFTLALALTAAAAGAARAQAGPASQPAHRFWLLAPGAGVYTWSDQDGAGALGSLHVTRVSEGRLGLDLAVHYFGPVGFYDLNGVMLDVGGAYAWPVGRVVMLTGVGVTGAVGGDSDGGGGALGGVYGSLALVARMYGPFALRLGGALRASGAGGQSVTLIPSGSFGIGVAF